jgi:hypothetical protein
MKTNQLITKVEKQIAETQLLITNYKNKLASQENMLQTLTNQLTEIKENMKLKNTKNNALKGEINN